MAVPIALGAQMAPPAGAAMAGDKGIADTLSPRAEAWIAARPWERMKDAGVYAQTCYYYENRAKFRPRGTGDFVVFLSDACEVAHATLPMGGKPARAAGDFLDRLVTFRQTIMTINRERVYGTTSDPRAKPLTREGEFVEIGQVSETGEFLIAHRMGLLHAFDRWAEETPDVVAKVTERAVQ